MTCESCGDKPKKCNKNFTRTVVEIDNPEQITLMRKVTIPASMGDDTTVPPVVGKYKNVLLFYEANSKSYLYSSDGIPTLLANGLTDYEQAVNLPQINGVTLTGDKTAAQLGLQDKLTAGANISIDADNVISAVDTTYGPATDSTIGLVKPGAGLEVASDGTLSVDNVAFVFDTVADMKASTDLSDGDYAKTLGYYASNDKGGASYKISSAAPAGYYETLTSGLYAELIITVPMNVKQFGAKGDGTADDTISIQKAIDSCDEVLIPAGTYMTKAQDDEHKTGPYNHGHAEYNGGIHLKSNLKISGEGILKAITTDADNYCILRAYNCDNIEISGISIIGDRPTHTGVNGEYGHGIMLMHCENINIHNISISQTWGDGIYIGIVYGNTIDKQNKNIHINDINVNNISRDGISLCSVDGFVIEDSVFDTINRKDPKAGINIEPEGYGTTNPCINNVKIEGCRFSDCWRGVYTYINSSLDYTKPSNIMINNCVAYRGISGLALYTQASFNETVEGEWSINNFKVVDAGWSGMAIGNHYLKMPHISLNKPIVINCNQTNKNTDDNVEGWKNGSGISIYNDGLYDAGNITINEPYIENTKEINYINRPIYIDVTNSNSNTILNSPLKLDGLRPCNCFNTLVHDINDLMVIESSYFQQEMNPRYFYSIYKFGNVSGEAILNFQSAHMDKIADNNEYTIINNRNSGYLRIDLGSSVDTRKKIYPFDNTNRYISTNTPGASITLKKINGQWFATKMMGTWSN